MRGPNSQRRRRAWARPRPGVLRFQVALILWTFVATNTAALIHAATTVHTRCAEHGELIDGPDQAGHAAAVVAPASRVAHAEEDTAHGTIRAASGPVSADHHAHCHVGCAAHQLSTPAPAPALIAAASAQARQPVLAEAPRGAAGIALYRTAPKTSPPAA